MQYQIPSLPPDGAFIHRKETFYRANLIQNITQLLLILTLVNSIIGILLGLYLSNFSIVDLLINLAGAFFLVACLILNRRGYVFFTGILLSLTSWLFASVVIAHYGFLDPSTNLLVVVIVMTSLLIGKRAGLILVVVNSSFLLILAYAQTNGYWIPATEIGSSFVLRVHIFTYVITGALLFGATRAIDDALSLAYRHEQEVVHNHRLLQTYTQQLETQQTALHKSEVFYRALFEQANDGICLVSDQDMLIDANQALCTFLGYTRKELLNMTLAEILKPTISTEQGLYILDEYAQFRRSDRETFAIHCNGRLLPVEINHTYIQIEERPFFMTTIRDIQIRKEAEAQLHESQQLVNAIMDASIDSMLLLETDGSILDVNEAAMSRLGHTKESLIGQCIYDYFPSEIAAYRSEKMKQAIASQKAVRFEDERQGLWMDTIVYPLLNEHTEVSRLAILARDVTDQKKAEAEIKNSLQQKELLLKEIHHRVKNNLQAISSLLMLQADQHHGNSEVQAIFHASRSRVHTMALVHEKLYRSHDFTHIDFVAYLKDLIEQLSTAYSLTAQRVTVQYEIDDIYLTVETAVPLGLIINELISNIYKHAFPQQKSGQIFIQMTTTNKQTTLYIQDNGVGIAPGFDWQKSGSLGLAIVYTLVQQIKGHITFANHSGHSDYYLLPSTICLE